MYLLGVVFVFYLVNFSYSLSYEDLAKDECFKKIYVCGDHRVSITGGTGRLLTEPYRFGEVCRRHKEFIACIEDASLFCADNFTDLSLMILDNRRSVKMFCTDLEWKKNYFQSAACINRREQEVKDKCRVEENERVDDRPWWCLIPEPCEAIQRVFHCTIRKMEERCGYIAAEVFRRIHLLKVENQDVVCEFRLRNPRYCRYQRATKAPNFEEGNDLTKASIRRIGSMKPSTSEATISLSDTIIDSVKLLKKMKLLSLKFQDTETFVLKNLLSINYKLKKLLTDFYPSPESISPSYSKDFADEKSSTYKTENSDKTRVHFIKDSIFKLHELFNDKNLNLISDDHMEFSWKNLKEFPIEHMSCFWLKSSQNTFKCDIKVLSLKQEDKIITDADYDLWQHLSDVSTEDVEDLLDLPEFELSLIDSEENKTINHYNESEMEPLVFISIDDSIYISNLNLSDIHRNGLQVDDPEDKSEDIDGNWENDKLKSSGSILDGAKQVKFSFLIRNAKKNFVTESNKNSNCESNMKSSKHFKEKPNQFVKLNKSSEYNFPATFNLEEFPQYKN